MRLMARIYQTGHAEMKNQTVGISLHFPNIKMAYWHSVYVHKIDLYQYLVKLLKQSTCYPGNINCRIW
jgi:hypothetical protein